LKLSASPRTAGQRLLITLCAASLLVAPLAAPTALAQNRLPALGDSVSEDFGIGAERKLGDSIMREIRRDPDYADDPVLLEYLLSIFQPLVAAARQRGEITAEMDQRFAWEPFLVRDRSVNAFALPGGYMGVHLGLMGMTSSRDELASVLAHELSHVTQRHIARAMTNSRRASILGNVAMILGILAAGRSSNVDAAHAVIAGSQAAAIQGQLNFSRDMEREADRIGFAVMTSAGFAPGGMASMFEKLEHSTNFNDNVNYPYLRSHPLTTERIGEARSRMGTATHVVPASVLEHTAAQARARVLADTRVDSLRRWQPLDTDPTANNVSDKLAGAYESALASTLLRDWARADAAYAKALALVQGGARSDSRAERAVVLLGVQSQLARGDALRAEATLKPYVGEGTRPVALLAGRIAVASSVGEGIARQRADELQTWVAGHPQDSEAWSVLGQLWGRLGQKLRAVRADAESRYALGDLGGAIERLHAGQRMAHGGSGNVDFIEASVIDARLRDIEVQRKQIMTEEKQPPGG
jgi:predicted Zn-dependent protease